MNPLYCLGAHSDWYIGTRHETMPTPRPAITRPHCEGGGRTPSVWRKDDVM